MDAPAATMGRAQAAAAVVRRLNAAVKSYRIYAPGHAVRNEAVSSFMEALNAYHDRYGGFVLETHRTGLLLEGKPFEGGESIDNLARLLYAIGVWQLVWLPGTTEGEVREVLKVLLMDRETILAEGGFFEVLSKRGVQHVRVIELRPGDLDPTGISLETYHALLDGSLSPQDRAMLLGLLRLGPPQTRMLITVIVERTRQAFPHATRQELAARVYAALTALDRLVVDAPPGESSELLRHLADSVAELDDANRAELDATILARASEDLSARALLSAMTVGQIARMVMLALESQSPSAVITQVVQGLPLDLDKAQEVVALIAQQTGQVLEAPPLREELAQPKWIRTVLHDLADFQVTHDDLRVSRDEVEALVSEARVDDTSLALEHALTLLQLSLDEHDPRELYANLDTLVQTAHRLLQQGRVSILSAILPTLETLGMDGVRSEPAQSAMGRILAALYGMLTVKDVWLWDQHEPLLVCLRQVGKTAGDLLAKALREERDPVRRQVITAMLGKIGETCAGVLSAYLIDPNPEVARPIVQALVQMRSGPAIAMLKEAARHLDPRIRREAVEALGPSQFPEAQQALLVFLQDADPEIRSQVLVRLRSETARAATAQLIGMLQDRQLDRYVDLRMRVIEKLERINAREALPVLRHVGSPLKLRQRDRIVARRAREAVAAMSRLPAAPMPTRSEVRS